MTRAWNNNPAYPARWLVMAALLIMTVAAAIPAYAQSQTSIEIYASGLINPKGMAFTPDGTLYIAESGAPGDVMVPLPAAFGGEGPIGRGGRVSSVPPNGERQDFVTDLPNIGLYGGIEMIGAGSVAVLDGELYEVAAGHMTISPLLSRVTPEGELETISDVGAFNDANPPPPSNGDAVPMGNPYDLIALDGKLYITDGNYNRIIEATLDGELSVLAQWENSPVTVGGAAGPGPEGAPALYVAQFGPAPYLPGTGRIDRVTPEGEITEGVVSDLTTPIDVAFAPDGTMYVLQYAAEFSAEELRYIPFGGEVQRVNADGTTSSVVTGLVFPTSLAFGPDGALYVTNYGNEGNEGQGQVLKVIPGETPASGPEVPEPESDQPYAPPEPDTEPTEPEGVEIALTIEIVEGASPDDWGYEPAEATIEAGQAIRFVNVGQIAHTATADDGSFDTGLLQGGESAVIVFDEPGSFAGSGAGYYCQPHPWMRAQITVLGEGSGEAIPGTGAFEDLEPPSVKAWQITAFAGTLLIAVIGGGFIMRRRETVPDVEPDIEPAEPDNE
ncbi:hypothetical protein BH23CHL2_BH23CHL2_06400 [soil metagenome]